MDDENNGSLKEVGGFVGLGETMSQDENVCERGSENGKKPGNVVVLHMGEGSRFVSVGF